MTCFYPKEQTRSKFFKSFSTRVLKNKVHPSPLSKNNDRKVNLNSNESNIKAGRFMRTPHETIEEVLLLQTSLVNEFFSNPEK